jgi:hypothetical protein
MKHTFAHFLLLGALLLTGDPARTAAAESRPAGSVAATAAVCRAVQWLRTQQLPDGSFGFRAPDGSVFPSASATADVVYALALLGENPAGPAWTRGGRSALAGLEALAPTYVYNDAGQAGKAARAAALAGGNPRAFGGLDLIAIIQAAYDPTTGRYDPYFAYRHTLAVEGLLRAGVPVPPAALAAVLQAQLSAGGWAWSFERQIIDVDSTGRALQLLAGLTNVQAPEAFARAADYLAAAQTPAGGWRAEGQTLPPNANSTALAVDGLAAAGFDPQAERFQRHGRGGLETLLSFQEASGAFVYIREAGKEEVRLMATADALAALVRFRTPGAVCRASYLPLLLR